MIKKVTQRKDGSIRVQFQQEGKTRTQKNQAYACDINNIMAQYMKKGGSFHRLPDPVGLYADLSSAQDLQTSMDIIIEAQRAFDILPAQVRERFKNSPVEFLKFMDDPNTLDEKIKLGLAKPNSQPQPKNENKPQNENEKPNSQPQPKNEPLKPS